MAEIVLTQGQVAIVDEDDFDFLNRFKWCVCKTRRIFYAVRAIWVDGEKTLLYMHRLILNAPEGSEIDHRDGDGLNNSRENIRICSHRQNQFNRKLQGGMSRFKGVSWDKRKSKWHARIGFNGQRIHLGLFTNEEEAARSYNKAASKYFGKFARFNEEVGNEIALHW